tara:strand:+ start:5915 stop:6115 length:201 start_codon:yes stop_codon:yes gene_type:complete
VNALIKTANSVNYHPELISAVDSLNKKQKHIIVKKIIARFGEDLDGKHLLYGGFYLNLKQMICVKL